VLFDLDNTLIDRALTFRRWAAQFCLQRRLPEGSIDRLIVLDGDGYRPREEFFADVRAEFKLRDTSEELMNGYRTGYLHGYVRDQAVLDALGRLRSAGSKVIVVTNGQAAYQRDKIVRTGLAESIDGCCISEVIGAAKPSPAIFQAAAAMAKCPLEGWMVGDSPEHDIAGGLKAGLGAIWISRGRRWEHPGFSPSHTCDSVIAAVEVMLAVE